MNILSSGRSKLALYCNRLILKFKLNQEVDVYVIGLTLSEKSMTGSLIWHKNVLKQMSESPELPGIPKRLLGDRYPLAEIQVGFTLCVWTWTSYKISWWCHRLSAANPTESCRKVNDADSEQSARCASDSNKNLQCTRCENIRARFSQNRATWRFTFSQPFVPNRLFHTKYFTEIKRRNDFFCENSLKMSV